MKRDRKSMIVVIPVVAFIIAVFFAAHSTFAATNFFHKLRDSRVQVFRDLCKFESDTPGAPRDLTVLCKEFYSSKKK